jgi:hypothetical protein
MTKALSPEEKARRAEERRRARVEEIAAAPAIVPPGDQTSEEDSMAEERDDDLDPETEDGEDSDLVDDETEVDRDEFVDGGEVEESESDGGEDESESEEIDEDNPARGKFLREHPNHVKCEGSGLDVEEESLEILHGAVLRDRNPWDYRKKRIRCPHCSHSVGVSPFGRRTEEQPVGYRLDTHYRKIDSA